MNLILLHNYITGLCMNLDAIILARSGFKGIPKKNLTNFCGFPLNLLDYISVSNVKKNK